MVGSVAIVLMMTGWVVTANSFQPEPTGSIMYQAISVSFGLTESSMMPVFTVPIVSPMPTMDTMPTKDPSTNMTKKPPPPRCPEQIDMFGLYWPRTPRSTAILQPCPSEFTGQARRSCNKDGKWRKPDIMECLATSIDGLDNVTNTFFGSGEDDMENAMYFVRQLRNLTRPPPRSRRGPFLSRRNLRTINSVTRESLRLLRMDPNATSDDVSDLFNVFSNALDARNRETWESLQETESGSEELLNNAENFASIAASKIERKGEIIRYSEENIALRAELSHTGVDLSFPSLDDLVNTTSIAGETSTIKIPSEYIRAMAGNAEDLPTVFMLFPTLQEFLPYMKKMDENITIGSVILSAQIMTNNTEPYVLANNPVEINFTINVNDTDDFTAICVYWNFTNDFNSTDFGSWVSDGIITEIINDKTVRCLSSHLTSFAVLVDVSGTHSETANEISPVVNTALSIVSYIGCAVSIVCLVATIIFLLTFRKELFIKVHYFIHLNLAISLLFGFIVFIAGINYASKYEIPCKLVSALLHYFFLSAFCWMLCEAIMMYLLMIVVFSDWATRWYIYMLIGWGVPLVIVSVTLGSSFDMYIQESGICWLNYSHYVILGFVVPMCVIIAINTIVLAAVFLQFYRTKTKRLRRSSVGIAAKTAINYAERRKTVIDLVKGITVLLPLLGITWIVGLFAMNRGTLVFAWIFTFLNCFQGVFIFVFHVVYTQKFRSWIKNLRPRYKSNNLSIITTTKSLDSLDQV